MNVVRKNTRKLIFFLKKIMTILMMTIKNRKKITQTVKKTQVDGKNSGQALPISSVRFLDFLKSVYAVKN